MQHFRKTRFTTFFKLLAFPQFLRYNGEIDMHGWNMIPVGGMNG